MPKKKLQVTNNSAVMFAFDATSDSHCPMIRDSVDRVLAGASNNHVTSTTANNLLLKLFVLPDNIGVIYIQLNRALANFQNFSPIGANAISNKSTIGDVRQLAYKACGATCQPI